MLAGSRRAKHLAAANSLYMVGDRAVGAQVTFVMSCGFAAYYLSIDLIKPMLYNMFMDVFAALAEPTRRQILEILAQQGQLPASAIYEQFEVTPQAISQHLKVLREAKLVSVERQGQQRLYSLVPGGVGELEAWARRTRRQWDGRMDRLERLLAAETERAPRSEGDAEEDG